MLRMLRHPCFVVTSVPAMQYCFLRGGGGGRSCSNLSNFSCPRFLGEDDHIEPFSSDKSVTNVEQKQP